MPRNYQSTKSNPYLLPHDIYMRVLYTIRGYDRRKEEYEAIPYESTPPLDGLPRGGRIADQTADKAVKRALIFEELEAIDFALTQIPKEYRQGVKYQAMYGGWFPQDADARTYRRWKQKFFYYVAQRLKLL